MGDAGKERARDAEVVRSPEPSEGQGAALDELGPWRRPILAARGDDGEGRGRTTPSVADALARMGARFGRDFGDVGIHDSVAGDQLARAAGSEAVTIGKDIYFRRGALAPDTERGKRVLGHELAHVVQQGAVGTGPGQGGAATEARSAGRGERGSAHEREAHGAAEAIAAGDSPRVSLRTSAPAVAQGFESYEHANLGNRTHQLVGSGAMSVSDIEKARLEADKTGAGGGLFNTGQRSLSVTLRERDPATNRPTATMTTVMLSYGEMLALSGDVYSSVDSMKKAPADEVLALRNLIGLQNQNPTSRNFDVLFETATQWRHQGVYRPGTGEKEGTKGELFGGDTQSYLELATGNEAHFSALPGTTPVAAGPEGNAAHDNHQGWLTDHSHAIAIANQVRDIKRAQSVAPFTTMDVPTAEQASAQEGAKKQIAALENEAYLYNAGADHYLTDAFSAGHLFNKGAIAGTVDKVMSDATLNKLAKDLAPFAKRELHPHTPERVIEYVLRGKLEVFKKDPVMGHNAGAKLIHDYLNVHGLGVTSRNGRFSWLTKGDASMDAKTADVASRSVLASRNYLRAVMNDSDADLAKPENADDAWEYTPNVDVAQVDAGAEAMLRAALQDTAHLWDLMKSVMAAQQMQEQGQKSEATAAQSAKHDTGGDWGQDPNNARFTKRVIAPPDK